MRDLIKEELNKIKRRTLLENNEDYYPCQRFTGNKLKYALCKRIASTGSWLYDDKGLRMKSIIMDTLKPLYSEYDEEEKKKFTKGARILKKIDKIDEGLFNWFIQKYVNQNTIVKVNGKWHPVNKLNTNHRDLSEFLTDLITKTDNRNLISQIIQDPKKGLNSIKSELPTLIGDHFEDTQDIFDYTKNTNFTSRIGEEAEESVKNKLEEMGFTVVYQGGDGDIIDMIFGTDLIVGRPDLRYKTVQVKRNEGSWDRSKQYKFVDWVIIADPFTIYDNKTKQPVEL
jgi:hypothetical protein